MSTPHDAEWLEYDDDWRGKMPQDPNSHDHTEYMQGPLLSVDVVEDAIPNSFVFTYPAVIDRWIDGDTPVVHRATQPGQIIHGEHIRVQGINAPELSDSGGKVSKLFAEGLAPTGTLVTLSSTKKDKYGRFLARITLPDGTDFSERMIATGNAVPYLT